MTLKARWLNDHYDSVTKLHEYPKSGIFSPQHGQNRSQWQAVLAGGWPEFTSVENCFRTVKVKEDEFQPMTIV
jgi:hypothetical protein